MADNTDSILKDLESFSRKFNELNLVSQAHARAILSQNIDSESNWPNFRKDLDLRIYYAANYQILEGLNLLNNDEHEKEAKNYLKLGAESLEYLYRYPRIDDSFKLNILIKSIFAYYISSNYAQAYVLTKELEHKEDINSIPILNLLLKIIRKDLLGSRVLTLKLLTSEIFDDEKITYELSKGKIDEEEAISRVLTFSTFKAVSIFLEYIKSGTPQLFDDSRNIITTSLKLAREFNLVDLWWLIYILSYILDEFAERNLWVNLKPFKDSNHSIKRYIKSYLRHKPPIIELWPSQIDSLPLINDNENRSFCLKMPTSAGKTQIAELTILKYLLEKEDENKKCVYVAPFRSLAAQVEKNLQQSLGAIGFSVSEIYGGFDLNPIDDLLIEKSKILVMTPEKFDAIIRYKPEIRKDIGLIVIDEGHIIDPNERGLNFEFFLQRLLNYYKNKDCRFLFISAVLPNAEDFAKWITGSPDQLVESNWRPSRLMLGKLVWNGSSVRIIYTHENNEEFQQECFVPNFIERFNCQELTGIQRTHYPNNAKECLAYSSLLFAKEGTTLVFAGQKREVKPFGKEIVQAIKIYKEKKRIKGEEFDLINPDKREYVEKCKKIIESELGEESYLLDFLNFGFVIHHGGLPHKVRVAIEDLVRSNGVPLIIATSTLAEGVNLPIKTVLVKSIYHGFGIPIDPLKFWNICGRAGRAGKENEGQILFLIDNTENTRTKNNKKRNIDKLINKLNSSKVVSIISKVLFEIVLRWKLTYPHVDVTELCVYLANESNDWILNGFRERNGTPLNNKMINDLMDRLDSQLLSLMEESDIEISPEDLSEILKESLLFIQLDNYNSNIIDKDLVTEMLKSRLNYIYSTYPDPDMRTSFYKLGMKLSDCDKIEENWKELYDLFSISYLWDELPIKEQIDLLTKIAEFLFELSDVIGENELPHQWKKVLELWLKGNNTVEMVENSDIKLFINDPAELREFIEDFFVYRLSWGFNSVLNYFSMFKETELPIICSYFPAIIKNGVIDPNAVCILPYVNQERDKSLKLAAFCPLSYEKPKNTIKWFKNLRKEDLTNENIKSSEIKEILNFKKRFFGSVTIEKSFVFSFDSEKNMIRSLKESEKVLLIHDPRKMFDIRIYTLDGTLIDIKTMDDQFPRWIFEIHIVNSEIRKIYENNGVFRVSILVEM